MTAKELILDGGERLDGSARMLRLNDTPSGKCVAVRIAHDDAIVAVLDKDQQRRLVEYLVKRLFPL